MTEFRVYFAHITKTTIEANSSDEARNIASAIARQHRTTVTKIKRVRDGGK